MAMELEQLMEEQLKLADAVNDEFGILINALNQHLPSMVSDILYNDSKQFKTNNDNTRN